MNLSAARQLLLETLQRISSSGLSVGTTGNVSVRLEDGLLISPSAMLSEDCTAADMVFLNLDGEIKEGGRKPSSEWRFHADIYRQRPEAGAIVHTHASHCTALACLGRGIPAFHYMVAIGGGEDIRCCGYETFGTAALSEQVLNALHERKACLMGNHGMVCFDYNLESALQLAVEIENLAGIYLNALQVGEPKLLSHEQMQAALERFADYHNADSTLHDEN